MITRRHLVFTGLLLATEAPLARAEPTTADDPVAIMNAIYVRVAKGKGDGGGAFVWADKAGKAKYLSKSLAALWVRADARTKGNFVGPIDFDPVTNSQDADVKSFKVETEKLDAGKALITVTLTGHTPRKYRADDAIHYAFVRDGSSWRIDDIKGTVDAKPWSVRGLLNFALKA